MHLQLFPRSECISILLVDFEGCDSGLGSSYATILSTIAIRISCLTIVDPLVSFTMFQTGIKLYCDNGFI